MRDRITSLEWSVRALAQPEAIQRTLFPSGIPAAEEMALEFSRSYEADVPRAFNWSAEQRASLIDLDSYLESKSGETHINLWLDEDALLRPEWNQIRFLAGRVLTAFAWSSDTPGQIRAIYVRHEEEGGEPGATDNPDDAQRLREDH
jgi:hypothetical protein